MGRGLRGGGVERGELFITTKLSQRWHGYQEAQEAFAISCRRLGLDDLDLFLIHWPNPSLGRFVDAWRGMIELLQQERVRAIGVSNFKPSHLQRLIDETGVVPHVNQIQLAIPGWRGRRNGSTTTNMASSPSRGHRSVKAGACSATR